MEPVKVFCKDCDNLEYWQSRYGGCVAIGCKKHMTTIRNPIWDAPHVVYGDCLKLNSNFNCADFNPAPIPPPSWLTKLWRRFFKKEKVGLVGE